MKLFNKEYKVIGKNKGMYIIVITENLDRAGIIDLCKRVVEKHGLKILKVYATKKAWEHERKQIYDDLYAEGYLVHCTRVGGIIKVTWVQEKGKFGHLQGQVDEIA